MAIRGRSEKGVERATQELSQEAKIGNKVVGKAADISSREQVAALFEFAEASLGGLDILVNNAGAGVFGSVAELSEEACRQVLDTNVTGVYLCCHEAVARFRNRGSGFVINISSLAGKNPFAGGAAYNASKFALNGFSEAMMLDRRQENIRISTILPGSVATEFSQGGPAEWKIAPDDVADVVLTVLTMPERTLISSVEIRPARPPK